MEHGYVASIVLAALLAFGLSGPAEAQEKLSDEAGMDQLRMAPIELQPLSSDRLTSGTATPVADLAAPSEEFLGTEASNGFVEGSSSSRKDLVGGGFGAAIGAVLARSLTCSIQETPCGWRPLALLLGAFGGGVIGAGIASGL
jgi:hypothetical protein